MLVNQHIMWKSKKQAYTATNSTKLNLMCNQYVIHILVCLYLRRDTSKQTIKSASKIQVHNCIHYNCKYHTKLIIPENHYH